MKTSCLAMSGVLLLMGGVIRAQSACAADWPQLTGPNGDNTTTTPGLTDQWPKEGPKLVWEIRIAGGNQKESGAFASPVAAGGRVFVVGRNYEADPDSAVAQFKNSPDILYCLDATNGQEVWKKEFPLLKSAKPRGHFKTCWNTPVVDGDVIYARSGNGEVYCIDVKEGKTLWIWPQDATALEKKMNQGYGIAASSAIVDGLIVCNEYGGGGARMIALDKKTGEVKWEGKLIRDWGWAGSSLIPMTIAGKKVILTYNYVVDAETGEFLVKDQDASGKPVNTWGPGFICWCSTFKGNRLLTDFTREIKEPAPNTTNDLKGTNISRKVNGVTLVEFSANKDGTIKSVPVWEYAIGSASFDNSKAYGGPVIVGGYAYVFLSQSGKNRLACLDLADGKEQWRAELKHPVGFANTIAADGKIFYQWNGQLTMLAANPKEYAELASAKVLGAGMSSPALMGTRLFLRDDTGVVKCFELAR